GIRDFHVTGVQTCALPIYRNDLLRRDVGVIDNPQRLASAGARNDGLVQRLDHRLSNVVSHRLLEDGQSHDAGDELDGDPNLQLVVTEADRSVYRFLLLARYLASGKPHSRGLSRRHRNLDAALDTRLRDPRPDTTGLLHLLDYPAQNRGRDDGPDVTR